jgi:hypothetical protein
MYSKKNHIFKIQRVEDFWDWSMNVLAPGLRANKWYDGSQPYNLAGYLNDKTSRMIGWALIRQVRVMNGKKLVLLLFCFSEKIKVNQNLSSCFFFVERFMLSQSKIEKSNTFLHG